MKVINFYAGPGAGKSTTCALLFAKLKLLGLNVEMALEYAKDKVWEESFKTLENQIYVFGKQHHRIYRLKDKVDFIITDSPLLFSIQYDATKNSTFKQLVLGEYNKYNNINFFIKRDCVYNPKGRMQNEEEAKQIDNEIFTLLNSNNIPFYEIDRGEKGVDEIFSILKKECVE